MVIRKRIELENQMIQKQIEERALHYMETQLGEQNVENEQAMLVQKQEMLQLMKENKQCLMPEGVYTMSSVCEFRPKWINADTIQTESIIALCCKEFESSSVTKRFLMHLLQVSYMNAVRDYVRELVLPMVYQMNWNEKAKYVTQYYGPGFFDMPFEQMEKLCSYVEAEKVGIKQTGGLLSPSMSFVGAIYITKEKVKEKAACKDCKASIGCEYCMKRQKIGEKNESFSNARK